jgi:uncharacterized membrane-anchored protein
MKISKPGEKLIKQYLNKIRKNLRASGYEKDEIDAVLAGTEEQILDQLTDNSLSDSSAIEAIIDTMDSPDAYSQFSDLEANQNEQQRSDEPNLAKLGLISAITGPFAAILFGMLAALFGGEGTGVGSLFFLTFEATAIILGGLQFKHRMGKSALLIALLFSALYFSMPRWIDEESKAEESTKAGDFRVETEMARYT